MGSRGIAGSGRVAQRGRTRKALLEAAARVIERNEQPRLAAVAAEAGVSRATVYRYFPSEQALLLEAPLDRQFAAPEDVLADLEDATVLDRVLAVHHYVFDHGAAHEAQFRLFFAALHELAAREGPPKQPLRAGRRRKMFELALSPLDSRIPPKDLRRLRDALVGLTGADAVFVMRDICGLTPRRARSVTAWAVERLVQAALAEHGIALD